MRFVFQFLLSLFPIFHIFPEPKRQRKDQQDTTGTHFEVDAGGFCLRPRCQFVVGLVLFFDYTSAAAALPCRFTKACLGQPF